MSYQAAAIQYDCRLMDKEYNLEQLTRTVRQAAGLGAKLVVLPEMCATGYYFDSQEQAAQEQDTAGKDVADKDTDTGDRAKGTGKDVPATSTDSEEQTRGTSR